MPLPYVPDDSHYYDSVNQGGDALRHYQDLMAEENAATTSAQGANNANMISNLPSNVMSGADFSMKRAQNQQGLDIRNSEEQRAQQMFGPQLQSANISNDQGRASLQQAQFNMETAKHRQGLEQGAMSSEEANVIGHPEYAGMPRDVVNSALGTGQGAAGLAATRAGTAASNQQLQASQYGLAHEKLNNAIGGQDFSAPPSPAPQAPTGSVADRAAAAINGFQPVSAPAPAPQQPSQQTLNPEQVSAAAKKYGLSEDEVRSSYRNMQVQRQMASEQHQMGMENFRALTPANQEVRSGVTELKGKIQALNQAWQSADRYKSAAAMGSGSFLANTLPGNSGWVESEGQKVIRKQAAQTLAQMGDYEGASEINSTGVGDMSQRIKDATAAAIQKETADMDAFINAHSRFANDPEMVELKQNVEKLRQMAGSQPGNLNIPKANSGNGMSTVGFFRQ